MRQWTEDQKRAIYAEGNTLVNAAAGSGKTAVLVERIIQKLIPDENGEYTDIDRLLVVTFARDAAAEMKSRIKEALSELSMTAEPAEKRHFRRQLRLLSNADITTIDSFCMKVVRNHFHALGIDPKFGMFDQTEVALLKEEAAEEFFDLLYEQEDNAPFLLLTRVFSGGVNDDTLQGAMLSLYDFTRALPYPKQWIHESVEAYSQPFGESVWAKKRDILRREACADAAEGMKEVISGVMLMILGDEPDEDFWEHPETVELTPLLEYWPDEFFQLLLKEYRQLKMLADSAEEAFCQTALQAFLPMKKSNSKKEVQQTKNWVIDQRAEALQPIMAIKALYSVSDGETQKQHQERIYPVLSALEWLVNGFADFYAQKKAERNKLEFNDTEHLCLELFLKFPEIAGEYREKYQEILMDEYQDTNGLQEEIFHCISNGHNRFMVGDMKQSIYRFRQSDPLIFKEKDRRYEMTDEGSRIVLSANFRSRRQVLDSVNTVFNQLMYEDAAELNYDESQRLVCGNRGYGEAEAAGADYTSELWLLERPGRDVSEAETEDEEREELDKVRLSARFTAGKIREMIDGGFQVLDNGAFRPMRPGDVVILASAVRNISGIYTEELAAQGLDCLTESTGYFDRTEILFIVNLIRIINNPYQDIPLLSVLRSPVFRFTEDELVKIRLQKSGPFFGALMECREDPKCRDFLDKLQLWRDYAKYMPSDKLIWTLYTQTGFYDMAGILYGGEEAQANLRLLFQRAREYEDAGFKGLFDFSAYIDRIRQSSSDLSGAGIIGDGDHAVRIMTIHKSKGLEFPVVFLCSTEKQFHRGTPGQVLSLNQRMGIGIRSYAPEEGYMADTVARLMTEAVMDGEDMAENMRKLYVAMTRPKEKLIVVGAVDGVSVNSKGERKGGIDDYLKECRKQAESHPLKKRYLQKSRSYLDWLIPAIMAGEQGLWQIRKVFPGQIEQIEQPVQQTEAITDPAVEDALYTQIKRLLEAGYSYAGASGLPSKLSVSQIKRLYGRTEDAEEARAEQYDKFANDEFMYREPMLRRPAFLEKEHVAGARLGTAYHNVFAYIDLTGDMDEAKIEAELLRLTDACILTEAEAEAIETGKIQTFFASALGREMRNARVYREAPFEISIPAGEITGDGRSEELLLQGIIDCYYETAGGKLVLFDYKTDACIKEDELAEKYKIQLYWYKRALEKILSRSVDETYIYSVYLDREILIEF